MTTAIVFFAVTLALSLALNVWLTQRADRESNGHE